MHPFTTPLSRRRALQSYASGFGYTAFAALAASANRARAERELSPRTQGPLAPKLPHFPARAKRVVFLCMNGGPSHVDLFDHKPELQKKSGERMDLGDGAENQYGPKLLGSPFAFARQGESGLWMSEVLPELARHADDLCVLHGMHTDLPNHSQAFLQLHTGSFQFTRPSLGAWTLYGLGTENANLPGFITLNPPSDNGGARNYGSGFLPAACQGTRIGGNRIPGFYAKLLGKDEEDGPPMRNLENPDLSRSAQRRQVDLVRSLDRRKLQRDEHHPEIEGAIESFELAFRMQDEIPDVLDTRTETKATLDAYDIGSDRPGDRFGRQCLLARRMLEAGVRFVELTSPEGWDHHFLLGDALPKSAAATDKPVAALLADLKQRGLLEDTLVVWAGEFGRTPYGQSVHGRDHNHRGFTLWMAGGGVRGGLAHGATDEYGYRAVDGRVHIHDLHATILHLLGFDHERLTFDYAGREFRLTDVYGDVVTEILA